MSKISRSIVVAIFVVLISFLCITDFVYINKVESVVKTVSNWSKIGYVTLIIVLVSLYTYVREKISRKKLQKKLASLYKYTYIILVMLATTFFKVYKIMDSYSKGALLLYFVLVYFIGILAQQIIFNVSKSGVLSILSMFVTFTLPSVIEDNVIDINSKLITVFMLASIYLTQILLDELKQLNIKNRKYLIEAVLLGVAMGISTLVGVNYLIWIGLAIGSVFITSNLDSTSLNLSNRQNRTIKKRKNNYFIYKIERIKISKLIISLCLVTIICGGIYIGGRGVVTTLANHGNNICINIINDLRAGINTKADMSFSNIKVQAYNFASMSTRFYIVCYLYIICMEILAIVLKRKYDTKSTAIKIVFMMLYGLITIFKLDIIYYQPVLTIMLVIICIVNTTNIYYNREERIKMIEA